MDTAPRKLALAALLACAALAAAAQSTPRPRPPGTTPLEEPPPIPAADAKGSSNIATNPAPEPQVTTRQEGENSIVEYRVNGKLYMQRVTPRNGPAYVLIDHKGDGTFVKQDNTLSPHLAVPQWVLLTF